MSKSVRILFTGETLKIVLGKKSPLAFGRSEIFFTNVLAFEHEEDEYVFYAGKNPILSTLVEAVTYIKAQKIEVELDAYSAEAVQAYEQGNDDIAQARNAGTQVKKNPPAKLDIPGFVRTLKPYQIPAVAHFTDVKHAANFSVPGSGKTTVTLAGYAMFKSQGTVDRMVVICPRAAFVAWEEEYKGCFGKPAVSIRITGTLQQRKALYRQAAHAELLLITYQMASQDENLLAAHMVKHKVMLILDESHYIKRMEGGKWATTVIALAPVAKVRCILSGTPVPNSLQDLYSQMSFLWPSPRLLGPSDQFREKIKSNDAAAVDYVKSALYPFYYRIHKSQIKIKKPQFHWIPVRMGKYQQSIYDTLAVRLLNDLVKAPAERTKLRTWRKARMTRLLQTASNPALLSQYSYEFEIPALDASALSVSEIIERYPDYETPPKLKAVITLTEKLLRKKEKVIIWTSFIHNIKTLERLLAKYKPRVVYGDIPKDDSNDAFYNREKMIREFKTTDTYNVLIANPAACAESVSLHKICHHALYLDRTFNCALYMQSLDRIHRIGLAPDEQVHYYIFQSINSIDDVIQGRLNDKERNMYALLNDDFAILNLDAAQGDMWEESEEDKDFAEVIKRLKSSYQ